MSFTGILFALAPAAFAARLKPAREKVATDDEADRLAGLEYMRYEIRELRREVRQLQDEVRALRSPADEEQRRAAQQQAQQAQAQYQQGLAPYPFHCHCVPSRADMLLGTPAPPPMLGSPSLLSWLI